MLKEIKKDLDFILHDEEHINSVDYICLKINNQDISVKVYCLDGHPLFEQNLDQTKKEYIQDMRKLGFYGISEIPFNLPLGKKTSSKFEIRLNIKSKDDCLKALQYCKSKIKTNDKLDSLLKRISEIDDIFTEESDYHSLYFCGFDYDNHENSIKSVSIYYKTLGLNDEDLSLNYIKFFDEIEIISHDSSFHLLKKLISKNLAVLMSIFLEIDFSGNFKLKYYCKIKDEFSIEKILKCFPKHEHQVLYLNLINDYSDLKLDCFQITSGYTNDDRSINLYYIPKKNKEKYYVLRDGIILRDIAGIYFLVDINDKHCYDLKKIYRVNETGKCIVEYLRNHICTLNGIVSYIRSVIINYEPEMYDTIYNDCETFIQYLINKGYIKEV